MEPDGVKFRHAVTPAEDAAYMDAVKRPDANKRTTRLAPNGKRSNLTNALYHLVRTKRFKDWFGDWEKAARIAKLRESEDIVLNWNGEYALDRESARSWAYDNLRGNYVNKDTGVSISVARGGIKKVASHGTHEDAHLKSVAAIPQIIENSVFIVESDAEKENAKYDKYMNYVSGIVINGVPYTVKMVVGEKDGKRYYDHDLTKISKGTLVDELNGVTNPVSSTENPLDGVYDTKLSEILQAENVSKVVDENGEPLVVYHDTNSKRYVNWKTGEDWDLLDWEERQKWDDRDDWDDFWEERDFYVFDRRNSRTTNEMPAHFFTPNADPYHEYGKRRIAAFLNLKNPIVNPVIPGRSERDNAGADYMEELRKQGYDGFIREYDGEIAEINAFDSNQIKSADPVTYDDAGNVIPLSQRFNPQNNDIRFSVARLYTGSAADYANRDENGNIVNPPSLVHIGTGEGSQVYGWGLYASSERGVAEG